jgi:hypothetical protein
VSIKINGVEVIDDARALANISNLKTVAGQSILGTGDIAPVTSAAITSALGYTPANTSVLGDIQAALTAING